MKKNYLKEVFLFLFSSLLLGCEPLPIHNRAVCVTLGRTHLLIPSQYFLPMFPPTLVPRQGLDKEAGELLEIPLNDLGYEIKMGQGYDLVLTFLITPISIHNSPFGLPATVTQARNGYGFYQNKSIEFDSATQLYRVSSLKYPTSVESQFFKSHPNTSVNLEKDWVAGCLSNIKEITNPLSGTCKTTFLYKDIHIQMTFSGEKIKLVDEFKKKVRNLFQELEVKNCSSKFTVIE